jgi:hypothetical protein
MRRVMDAQGNLMLEVGTLSSSVRQRLELSEFNFKRTNSLNEMFINWFGYWLLDFFVYLSCIKLLIGY